MTWPFPSDLPASLCSLSLSPAFVPCASKTAIRGDGELAGGVGLLKGGGEISAVCSKHTCPARASHPRDPTHFWSLNKGSRADGTKEPGGDGSGSRGIFARIIENPKHVALWQSAQTGKVQNSLKSMEVFLNAFFFLQGK